MPPPATTVSTSRDGRAAEPTGATRTQPVPPPPAHAGAAGLPPDVAAAAADPKNAFGTYVLVHELGRGGMGVVYRAYDRELRRTVALKLLLAGERAGADEVERFGREARAAAALSHEHIAAIYEVGTLDGAAYFTMEFVAGGGLDGLMRDAPLTPHEAASVLRDVAFALDYAHAQGIIHRDLKPANILIVRPPPEPGAAAEARGGEGVAESTAETVSGEPAGGAPPGSEVLPSGARGPRRGRKSGTHDRAGAAAPARGAGGGSARGHGSSAARRSAAHGAPGRRLIPKVADFGLAKNLHARSVHTVSGQVMGTPAYMPPEQAQGQVRKISARSDVYSLGATLYELATGKPPFAGATALKTLESVVRDEPRPPRALNSRLDRDLETIILKCLEKDPARRYASAGALAEDLDAWLEGEPIAARPPSALGRTWRGLVRRRVALVVGAAVVALIGAGAWTQAQKVARRREAGVQLAAALKAAESGEPAEALPLFTAVLTLDPGNTTARDARAQAEKAAAQRAAARKRMDRARELTERERRWMRDLAVALAAGAPADARAAAIGRAEKDWSQIDGLRAEATRELEAALESWPDFPEALAERARLAELVGDYARCELLADRVIRKSPDAWPMHLLRLRVRLARYLERLRPPFWVAGALPSAGAPLGDDPPPAGGAGVPAGGGTGGAAGADPETAALRARVDEALAPLAAGGGAPEEVRSYAGAVPALLAGRYAEAESALNRALDRLFDDPFAALFRADCRRASGNYAGAIEDYGRAIALGCRFFHTYLNRGSAALLAGRYRDALGDFGATLKLLQGVDPESFGGSLKLNLSVTRNNRGLARLALGDAQGGIEDFTEGILLTGKVGRLYVNRGIARVSTGDLERALVDYDKALALDPKLEEAFLYRAKAYHAQGKAEAALADYGQALARNPKLALAHVLRAELRHERREYAPMLEDAEAASRLEPGSGMAHQLRGVALTGLMRVDEAGAAFDEAVRVAPDLPEAWYAGGLLAQLRGEKEQAAAKLGKFLELAPTHQMAEDARKRLKGLAGPGK
ncbi:MAG: protein kinase [Planctomycetes bacterium]|nr:protein kinase [Planctomycetota bacterium]